MLRWTAGSILALGILAATLGWFGQRALVYLPDRADPGPAQRHLERGSDVELTTADGLTLTAWRVDPDPATSRDLAVLYLPGNGGSRLGRVSVAQALADEGFTVLLADYRGYGGNPGRPSEDGLVQDAVAAQAYLADAGFPPERTLYVGESLGTGVAAHLAERVTPAAVLLRSAYTSLGAVASHTFGGAPVGWAVRDRFDTLARMPAIACPVTVLAGADDSTVPSSQSRQVARAAPELFRWVELPDTGHNDAVWFGAYLAGQVADLAESSS